MNFVHSTYSQVSYLHTLPKVNLFDMAPIDKMGRNKKLVQAEGPGFQDFLLRFMCPEKMAFPWSGEKFCRFCLSWVAKSYSISRQVRSEVTFFEGIGLFSVFLSRSISTISKNRKCHPWGYNSIKMFDTKSKSLKSRVIRANYCVWLNVIRRDWSISHKFTIIIKHEHHKNYTIENVENVEMCKKTMGIINVKMVH